MAVIDLTGQRFGRLVALKQVARGPDGRIRWLCRCDCGTERITMAKSLRQRATRSCGCLLRERTVERCTIHGHSARSRTRTYRSWREAKTRCFNPKAARFKLYGGRGITMCEEWKNDFTVFLRDMGFRPEGTSLDRFPDQDGNYEPGNCRWATPKEQQRNLPKNIFLTLSGETLCVAAWAERLGISYSTIYWRIEHKWTPEQILSAPQALGSWSTRRKS